MSTFEGPFFVEGLSEADPLIVIAAARIARPSVEETVVAPNGGPAPRLLFTPDELPSPLRWSFESLQSVRLTRRGDAQPFATLEVACNDLVVGRSGRFFAVVSGSKSDIYASTTAMRCCTIPERVFDLQETRTHAVAVVVSDSANQLSLHDGRTGALLFTCDVHEWTSDPPAVVHESGLWWAYPRPHDATVLVRELATGAVRHELANTMGEPVMSLAMFPNRPWLAVARAVSLEVYDLTTGESVFGHALDEETCEAGITFDHLQVARQGTRLEVSMREGPATPAGVIAWTVAPLELF